MRGLFDPDLWPADATGSMPAVAAAMVENASAQVEVPDAEEPPRPSAHRRPRWRWGLPLQPAATALVGVLVAVSTGGLLFTGDASALSDDGAAVLLRGSMAGEPLSQDVAVSADGDMPIVWPEGQDPAAQDEPKPVYDVLLIGDSVSLRMEPFFTERFPLGYIDAHESRRIKQGIQVYQEYADAGQVGDTVVFALGTNGVLTDEDLEAAVAAVGPDKQIYFVTVRSADDNTASNTALYRLRDAHDNVHLIDWNALSADHGDYFDGDGTHLTLEAAHIYLNFIADAMGYPSAEEVLARAQAEATDDGQQPAPAATE